jgi:hypothetical protein
LATGSEATTAKPKSRALLLLTVLNLVVLGGLLYKSFGEGLMPGSGVTINLLNNTPGPMLDMVFEYPGGKLTQPKVDAQQGVGLSIPHLGDFDATLSFKNEQGQPLKQSVRVRPYNNLLVLLAVEPVLETAVVKTADGKEETVIKAAPKKIFITRSYQRPGGASGIN